MRYNLKTNTNGTIEQVERSADGGNIYLRKKELRQTAFKNLENGKSGSLGNLSNLQIFNFAYEPNFASVTQRSVYTPYNNGAGSSATSDYVIFNSSGVNTKGSYYNIIDIKANIYRNTGGHIHVQSDSFIDFWLLQNSLTLPTAEGVKIERVADLYGFSLVGTMSTNGVPYNAEYQSVNADLFSVSPSVPYELRGLRASGLALKTISLNFDGLIDLAQIRIEFIVYVDRSSVSTTY